MMKVRLNHFERVAGLFLGFALLGTLITGLSAAIKQGWFEDKIRFVTYFENADGLHQGTGVQMAGLQAGSVTNVELQDDNRIKVEFYVMEKFRGKIKEDSTAQLIRPFIIGERILEVAVGTQNKKVLDEHQEIPSQESVDLMTLLSGKKLGVYLSQTAQMLENLKTLMEAFLSKDRTQNMVEIFDKLNPLLVNMNTMSMEVTKLSKQATDQNNMKEMMKNVVVLTQELNKTLPQISAAMKEIGPDMPKTAKRAVEALDEATVLIKALQRSMLVRSSVKDVRDEERERERRPAGK